RRHTRFSRDWSSDVSLPISFFGYYQYTFVGYIVGYDHSDHFIIIFQRNTTHANGTTADGTCFLFRETYTFTVLRSDHDFRSTISKSGAQKLVIVTDLNGVNTVCSRSGISFKGRFLNRTVSGDHYHVHLVHIFLILKVIGTDIGLHLIVRFDVDEVLNGSAF